MIPFSQTITSVKRMTSPEGRHCLARIWFAAILLICIVPAVSCDRCQAPEQTAVVTENVANGSMLLKINYTNNQNWTIVKQDPDGYFELTKGNTSFYLIASKVLDYDVLKKTTMVVSLECNAGKYPLFHHTVYIIMHEVNEFKPHFTQSVFNETIPENARIGDVVFSASGKASDGDYDDPLTFKATKYSQGKNPLDGIGSGKFKMDDQKTGRIVVAGNLDYEKQKQFTIKMIVQDSGGNNTSAKLIINISDVDEVGPTFQPNQCENANVTCQIPVLYRAQIKAADKGQLTILPNVVKAVDMEADHYNVIYSLTEGDPINIEKYFKIDVHTALITKELELPKNVTSSVTLYIKAEEQSKLKHSSVAILIIDILDRNSTIIVSTKPTDSPISNSAIQGFSPEVFYGVLIPLVIIVGALSLCIVMIVIKSKKDPLQNDVEDFKTGSDKSIGSNVAVHTTDSLLSRNGGKATNRTGVEMLENGHSGVTNRAFVPDVFVGKDADHGKLEQPGSMSTEGNDDRPRSLHSDDNLDEFGYCNLTSAGMYTATDDLRKAGVGEEEEEEEETARDGDINKKYSTEPSSKDDSSTTGGSETDAILTNSDNPDRAIKGFSEDASESTSSDRVPEIPVPDYILEGTQHHGDSSEITWAVPKTNGQLESEVSEFLLTPDFIENVSQRSASSESLSAEVSPHTESNLESTGTTDDNHPDSNSMIEKGKRGDSDEDNTLPEWASSALQPTIYPMKSREEFKSHLESLMSSPRQLPPTNMTPQPSPQSLTAPEMETSEAAAAPPPPPPPPPPAQLPSSSTVGAHSTSFPPSPPIQMMATHL